MFSFIDLLVADFEHETEVPALLVVAIIVQVRCSITITLSCSLD